MEKLVSILTPCYNGAKYIDRYAKSLLNQDYSNCQLIFMNDGSTDNSEELILSYKDAFEKKGFSFEYHRHDNVGVGGTIAKGIKYVKGDYLIWPDIDDLLTTDSISRKVSYLECRKDIGIVRTRYRKLLEDKNNDMSIIGPSFGIDKTKENLFEDYLFSRNCWFQPGCFMVRMRAFDEANPDRYIFPTRRGQNWQMLLPVLYKYKCGFIDEPLYIYTIHSGSISDTSNDTLDIVCRRYEMYEELIVETIKHMDIPDVCKYVKKVHCYYLKVKFHTAFRYNSYEDAKTYLEELNKSHSAGFKIRIKSLFLRYQMLYMMYKIIRQIR